jgi:hypothetical protein
VYLRADTIEPAFAIVTFEAPEGPAANPSIQNGPRRVRRIKGLQWQTMFAATLSGKGYFGQWQTHDRA